MKGGAYVVNEIPWFPPSFFVPAKWIPSGFILGWVEMVMVGVGAVKDWHMSA